MAKNKLPDLNNHLFEMLEKLNDDELMEGDLEKQVLRAKALTDVAKVIIDNGKLMLDATKHADEYGYNLKGGKLPNSFGLENKKE